MKRARGATVFRSDFTGPDERWTTRHTPTPDLPAGEFAPTYRDGRLVLRLRKRDVDGQPTVHTSHLATTQAFQFGRFEARMRFRGPRGAHSAFWLQDEVPNQLGGAEVDVIEHFGDDRVLWHNVYWRTPETMWPAKPTPWRRSTKAVDPREWHVYGLDWHPDRYVFTIDGEVSAVGGSGLSAMPKIMIVSLLSSTYEHDELQRDNLDVYRTLVDWVRVSELVPS